MPSTTTQPATCKICEHAAPLFAHATILRKYAVNYFRCGHCGFIQTEEPYWLDEAYADAIVFSDVGLVGRNLELARTARAVISVLFNPRGSFLDYGGGYGLLVRLMRDRGFDFYRHDPWCANLLARGFDAEPGAQPGYELLTAFEVFEHLRQPVDEVRRMQAFSGNILFSTLLVPDDPPPPGQWWYYALEGGQHIGLFTRAALAHLAERVGLHLASCGRQLHLLTEKKSAARLFPHVGRRRCTRLVDLVWPKRKSLLAEDYRQLTGVELK